MIPLDRLEKWAPILDDRARRYLNAGELQAYRSIPEGVKRRQLQDILEKPIAEFTPVNEVFFRARWAEAVGAVFSGSDLSLLEIATGDADMIPQMLARAYPHSQYITANMNRRLNRRFQEKTRDLTLKIRLIEADAMGIENYLTPESLDLIAFQHAINDVIQAILCEREGVDTVDAEWMETLPKMIEILQRETSQNTLEEHAKSPFLSLMGKLLNVLKKGGTILMNHYMFQLDLDWGYPPALFENLAPLTRLWLGELPGCREVFRDGFQPQWWIFLQKI
jgi:hypothetical protein